MFPDQFPAEQIRTLIDIIRSRDPGSRRAELGYAIWTIQGYAMGQILGQPWAGCDIPMERLEKIDDEVIPMLEAAIEGNSSTENIAKGAVNWALVLVWLARQILPLFLA